MSRLEDFKEEYQGAMEITNSGNVGRTEKNLLMILAMVL